MGKTRKERDPVQEMRKRVRAAGFPPERIEAETAAFQSLREKYPQMYAVIREVWDGEKLVEPYLLAVSEKQDQMRDYFYSLPDAERVDVKVRYVPPAGQAMAYLVRG